MQIVYNEVNQKKPGEALNRRKAIYMERYDYHAVINSDVLDYIRDNYTPEEIREALADREEFQEKLSDDLWTADSVTGNGSGSYFCNAWKAEEAIAHNLDILADALAEFGSDAGYLLKEGAEAADVTIRCYLLYGAIFAALDVLEAEYTE